MATLLLTSGSSIYAYTVSKNLTHAIGVLFTAYYLTNFIFFLLKSIAVYKFLPKQNLKKKYGEWAIVTGCTDGIGKAFAIELSKNYGLNIVLISRTQSKLDDLAKELPTKTLTVAVDFSSTEQGIYALIKSKISGLDIGILVNNVGAGYDHPDYFDKISYEDIDRLISINCFPQTKMTHMVLGQMKSKKAGLVISLSSFSALYSMPLLTVYSACKEFNRYISESLRRENDCAGIQFQTIMPYFVTTKLAKIRKPSMLVPTPKSFVSEALRTAGHYNITAGYFTQHLYTGVVDFLHSVPIAGPLIENITFGHLASTMKRAYKKKSMKEQ